eukprot:3441401-Pyramimonas_sp.AAC.1
MRRKSEAIDALNEFVDDVKQMDKSPKHMPIKSDAEAVYIEGASSMPVAANSASTPSTRLLTPGDPTRTTSGCSG